MILSDAYYQVLTSYCGVRRVAGTSLEHALQRAGRWYGTDVTPYEGPVA